MHRLLTAIHRISHASALRATARTLLAGCLVLAVWSSILYADALSQGPEEMLQWRLYMLVATFARLTLAALVVLGVPLIVFSRLGTRRIDLGSSRRAFRLQMGRGMIWATALGGLEFLTAPIWKYREATLADVPLFAATTVLAGVALGLLLGLSRFGRTVGCPTRLAASPDP